MPLRVTVSVGAAALGHGPEEARALVAAADEALYRAKHAGKNRTEVAGGIYSPQSISVASGRLM